MAIDAKAPASRRRFIQAGLGAVGGMAVARLAAPDAAAAAANGNVQLSTGVGNNDNDAATETRVNVTQGGQVALSGVQVLSGSGIYGYAADAPGEGVKAVGGGSANGVSAQSTTGIGVKAASSSGVDLAASGTGRFFQKPRGTSGAPTSGTFAAGEQVRDGAGDLWLCTVSGTPGTWRKVRLQPAIAKYPAGTVTRISGVDRFATAAAISAATFAPGVPVAYIAFAFGFADALAGAAATGTLPGPILLAATSLPLNPSTTAELTRLKPKRIIVLGSSGVISEAVRIALAPYAVGG